MASLIDLHTHTSHPSPCGHMTAGELIEAAIEAGLSGVAVIEHLVPRRDLHRRRVGSSPETGRLPGRGQAQAKAVSGVDTRGVQRCVIQK